MIHTGAARLAAESRDTATRLPRLLPLRDAPGGSAKMETPNTSGLSLLADHLLKRMAEILEVTDPDSVTKLGERVEAALQEFRAHQELESPTPKELRDTFKRLSKSHRDLYEDMKQLGPMERKILEDAASDFPPVRLARNGRFGRVEAMAALERIGALLRGAQGWLPEVKHAPKPSPPRPAPRRSGSARRMPQKSARWFLVHRLGMVYSQTRPSKPGDPREEFEMPTRRHSDYLGKGYGPFRDFVVATHTALGFDDPERGVDDLIRSVWGGMGKKRRQNR